MDFSLVRALEHYSENSSRFDFPYDDLSFTLAEAAREIKSLREKLDKTEGLLEEAENWIKRYESQ